LEKNGALKLLVDRKSLFLDHSTGTDESGDHFIVELQRSRPKYLKIEVSTTPSFPIQGTGEER